jgi:hypothetical protein
MRNAGPDEDEHVHVHVLVLVLVLDPIPDFPDFCVICRIE